MSEALQRQPGHQAALVAGAQVGHVDVAHHAQVHRVGTGGQADVDGRVQGHERGQARTQPLERQAGRAMHRQHRVVGGQLHLGAGGLERIEQAAQPLEQPLTFQRGLHAAVAAFKQRTA